uniref:Uncharacterized protein n=1 Tax=Arundo donax TaxID=35708 RepID=A0A0A9BD84_ARUDO
MLLPSHWTDHDTNIIKLLLDCGNLCFSLIYRNTFFSFTQLLCALNF